MSNMLNQNSNNDPDYVMCPLYKAVIPIADCIDLQEVSGGFIKPCILPDEILKIYNYKHICNSCHNNFENYEGD